MPASAEVKQAAGTAAAVGRGGQWPECRRGWLLAGAVAGSDQARGEARSAGTAGSLQRPADAQPAEVTVTTRMGAEDGSDQETDPNLALIPI